MHCSRDLREIPSEELNVEPTVLELPTLIRAEIHRFSCASQATQYDILRGLGKEAHFWPSADTGHRVVTALFSARHPNVPRKAG